MNAVAASLNALQNLARVGNILICQIEWRGVNFYITWKRGSKRWWPIRLTTGFPNLAGADFIVTGTNKLTFSDQLYLLYHSENLRIFSRHIKFSPNTFDVNALLKLARETGKSYLATGSHMPKSPLHKNPGPSFEVCVAFWKDGVVRGSMMANAETIEVATVNATLRALNDDRWKPLGPREWNEVQIELTIFSPLKLPIRADTSNHIDYTKGYMVTRGNRLGLYVPEVFNAVRFRSRSEFLRSLAVDKAGISPTHLGSCTFVEFDVVDAVEDPSGGSVRLRASMPKPQTSQNLHTEVEITAIQTINWLSKTQEPDGNIPPITHTLSGSLSQFDFGRLAFVLFALAEWGKADSSGQSSFVANQLLSYLDYYLERSGVLHNINTSNLYGLVYLGHAYQAIGDEDRAVELLGVISANLNRFSFESILSLETITLNQRLKQSLDLSELEHICKKRFNQMAMVPTTDTASWAEAVVAFKDTDPKFADNVGHWLLSHQTPAGYFKQSMVNDFGYTRGTSKIFEVLAVDVNKYAPALRCAQSWLKSMQYNESNSFFIRSDFRKYVSGGFRHDYNNPDIWIDSSGHYILGASRILSSALNHDSVRRPFVSAP